MVCHDSGHLPTVQYRLDMPMTMGSVLFTSMLLGSMPFLSTALAARWNSASIMLRTGVMAMISESRGDNASTCGRKAD